MGRRARKPADGVGAVTEVVSVRLDVIGLSDAPRGVNIRIRHADGTETNEFLPEGGSIVLESGDVIVAP